MGYSSALKENRIFMICKKTWMNLQDTMLVEINQAQETNTT